MSEETGHEEMPDGAGEEAREGVGARLAAARQEAGYSIADVAKQTRIPERHLISIEQDEFSKLPARTYAVGFARSYARMLDLNERDIADDVRAQLAAESDAESERQANFEPGDPARVPSRGLAWLSAAAIVLLLVGGYSFYRSYFAPGMGPAPLEEQRRASAEQAAGGTPDLGESRAPSADGQVVFTALEDGIWAKFYDGSGERLYEAQMARGETFAVPRDADRPQIWTGRPDAFSITIDGQRIAPLAEDDQVMRDIEISAAALLARQGTETVTTEQPASPAPTTLERRANPSGATEQPASEPPPPPAPRATPAATTTSTPQPTPTRAATQTPAPAQSADTVESDDRANAEPEAGSENAQPEAESRAGEDASDEGA